jgi:hypothetical protein
MAPGEVLPPGIKPAIYGAPPVSFDQEINFARGEAELAAQTPDMGIEKPNQRGNEKRTAKEVGVASSIAQVGKRAFGDMVPTFSGVPPSASCTVPPFMHEDAVSSWNNVLCRVPSSFVRSSRSCIPARCSALLRARRC